MKFTRTNPVTGQVASEAVAMKPSDVAAIARRAADAFPAWSALGPNARRAVLMKAAAALEAEAARLRHLRDDLEAALVAINQDRPDRLREHKRAAGIELQPGNAGSRGSGCQSRNG